MNNKQCGIKFFKLDNDNLKLYVFVDAFFANNRDYSSQIGFVTVLGNEYQQQQGQQQQSDVMIWGNILHWSSTKCKCVTRSVLASELYTIVAGFNISSTIQATVNKIIRTGKNIPLIICTDSYSLYNCIIQLETTSKKHFIINIMGLQQSYECREISEIQ